MKIITPIAPLHGKADVFSDIFSPDAESKNGLDKSVVAVAIVVDDNCAQPYYVVSVNDNGDWYPALTFAVETTQPKSPWDS
ncbi:hypothetical protein ABK249_14475 [Neorhizobium sp. Rsf11]|uniref:Uncharacterized protein n=1 Tax=Neorhizobium phenanthreniclasticum TaxID=3157917 RepID=A0ABV0M388_9HYPH